MKSQFGIAVKILRKLLILKSEVKVATFEIAGLGNGWKIIIMNNRRCWGSVLRALVEKLQAWILISSMSIVSLQLFWSKEIYDKTVPKAERKTRLLFCFFFFTFPVREDFPLKHLSNGLRSILVAKKDCTENHRVSGVGKDLQGMSSPNPG